MQRTPVRRRPVRLKKARTAPKRTKAKKDTFADIRRSYGLPDRFKSKADLRYRQPIERGILWYWFSRYIRFIRDKGQPCISCGQHKDDYQGGHFIPAGQASVDDFVFDERNVHAECANCNLRDKRKLGYRMNLDLRYGPGTAEELERRYVSYRLGQEGANWGKTVYRAKIAYYRATLESQNSPENPEQQNQEARYTQKAPG